MTISAEPAPLLIFSASDSSGAAGMQVDIRVAQSLGAPVRCALTAITVQGAGAVAGIWPAPPSVIKAACAAAADTGIGAVKTGMLVNGETAGAVADALGTLEALSLAAAVVIDPVIRSTSGHELLTPDGIEVLTGRIMPGCTLVTPNRWELKALSGHLGVAAGKEEDMALGLMKAGAGAVLVTGGDTRGDLCLDTLYRPAAEPKAFSHRRSPGKTPRGTGCALATAAAAFLARGLELEDAVGGAIDHVQKLIAASSVVGGQRLLFP